MFESASCSLKDFFSQPGAAFYVPFYQRPYSWDRENVRKLMDDLVGGASRLVSNTEELRFFGTFILLTETQPQRDVHFDRADLITRVRNVIDGQQRISTFAVLACLLVERMTAIQKELEPFIEQFPAIEALTDTLANRILDLTSFYSVEVRKTKAHPMHKPIVIRALDQTKQPRTDQWTLNGARDLYYRSDVAALLAQFIDTKVVPPATSNEKLSNNIEEMRDWIASVSDPHSSNCEYPDAVDLVTVAGGSGSMVVEGEIDLSSLAVAEEYVRDAAYGSVRLLALVYFLQHRSFVTLIECPNEALAFDMFQSLNATGTPLTAFEVFKPLVVNTLGDAYGTSASKSYVDEVEKVLEIEDSAAGKSRLTDQILAHAALPYDGTEISTRFSQQRDWLNHTYQACSTVEREEFLRWLANTADYVQQIIRPKRPSRGQTRFPLVDRLMTLGLSATEADTAALCVYFLRDAQHRMAHYLLAVFYARLVRAQGHSAAVSAAASDFSGACKAAAAFFALWAGSVRGFPDEVYRDLFRRHVPKTGAVKPHMAWSGGASSQTLAFVRDHFKAALIAAGVFDAASIAASRSKWVSKARANLGYSGRKMVCRWALFATAHDMTADTSSGNEGLVTPGRRGSASYLNCVAWFSEDFEVIEHVATRDKPSSIRYPSYFDESVYPGNYSVVDQIGNLTLWSRSANSSTYAEWPDKAFYYASLTSIQPAVTANLAAMATALGLSAIPPALSHLAAASKYQPHLAPLAFRGEKGLRWDSSFVSQRTERMCALTFDVLNAWL